jgi:hypothetical protein
LSSYKNASICIVALLSNALGSNAAYSGPAGVPEFKQYSVAVADAVKPAAPDVRRQAKARKFRTMLRIGAATGPNFAGHFTFVSWGCGVACQEFAVVDATTGQVYFPSDVRLNAYQAVTDETPPFEFHLDSRLFVLTGAPNDADSAGTFYYEWTGSDFKLLKSVARTWPR